MSGWQLLPHKLTPEMYAASLRAMSWTNFADCACTQGDVEHLYAVLRAAAPKLDDTSIGYRYVGPDALVFDGFDVGAMFKPKPKDEGC